MKKEREICKKTKGRGSCDILYTSTRILTFDCRFQEIAVQSKNLHNTRKLHIREVVHFLHTQQQALRQQFQQIVFKDITTILCSRAECHCCAGRIWGETYYSDTHLCEAKFSVCKTTHNCFVDFLAFNLTVCFKQCLFTYQFFKRVKLQDVLKRHIRLAIARKFTSILQSSMPNLPSVHARGPALPRISPRGGNSVSQPGEVPSGAQQGRKQAGNTAQAMLQARNTEQLWQAECREHLVAFSVSRPFPRAKEFISQSTAKVCLTRSQAY